MPTTIIALHVTPKSARNQILGWQEGADGQKELKVKIAAPPKDGKANAELIRFLAKEWGLPKRDITLVSGDTSRHKRIKIQSDNDLSYLLSPTVTKA